MCIHIINRDGPNCTDPTYRHTIIYSTMILWNNNVYRFTVIMYSRHSCGTWVKKNRKARIFRQRVYDYSIQNNGHINYKDFHLTDTFDYKGQNKKLVVKKKDDIAVTFGIAPDKKLLTPSYEQRVKKDNGEKCDWVDCDYKTLSNLKWITIDRYPGISVIFLREFLNRYAFVSLYASQINKIRLKKSLTKEGVHELVYMALLTPSSLQFSWVIEQMISLETSELTHPMLTYIEICYKKGYAPRGGMNPRFQAQGDQQMPKNQYELKEQLKIFASALDELNSGHMLSYNGELVKNKSVEDLTGVGPVSALTFASLCVMVGIGYTKAAFATARQATVNNKSAHNYFQKLKTALVTKVDEGEPSIDPTYYYAIWKAVGKSTGEVIATMENSTCAIFRKSKKSDVFMKGQEMYDITLYEDIVWVKPYGTNLWVEMKFPKFLIE